MSFEGPTPTIAPFIPENAPFSVEQRAWLNGFFAGFLAPQPGDAQPVSGDVAGAAQDDDAPWHDPSIPLDDRMKLADGKPIQRRLMAAMAQQDCGQCGYNCNDYSKAITEGAEARLNLCVPGGKETFRMVKTLAESLGDAPKNAVKTEAVIATPAKAEGHAGYSRGTPVDVTFNGGIG